MRKNTEDNGPEKFELELANGKNKKFKTGYDMWKWATHNDSKMEFFSDDKTLLSLSDWFEKRRSKS